MKSWKEIICDEKRSKLHVQPHNKSMCRYRQMQNKIQAENLFVIEGVSKN